jgi:hypothetical protein
MTMEAVGEEIPEAAVRMIRHALRTGEWAW